MPTYEYECSKCGTFEVFQKMSAETLKECPKCQGKVRRLVGTGAGVIYKGSGFYTTEYRSESYKKKEKEEKEGVTKDTKDTKVMKDTKDTKVKKD